MATITNAEVRLGNSGQVVPSDCYGNNAAIECPGCQSYPVLLIALPRQRGSSRENPGICRKCQSQVHILEDVSPGRQIQVVHVALI